MRSKIEPILSTQIPGELVVALLNAHAELKEHFYFEKFRPSELEGGRFAEAAFRIVEHLSTGKYTPLGKSLPKITEDYLKQISNAGAATHESIRLHIPRVLFSINNVRNRRDVGHLGGDVNPNRPDAYLVMTNCDWVLAEFIRLLSAIPLLEAQALVDNLVERRIPIIQDINGFPKILNTELSVPDKVIAIAYVKGSGGFTTTELRKWLKHTSGSAMKMALLRLEREGGFLHMEGDHCVITISGIKYAEKNLGKALT